MRIDNKLLVIKPPYSAYPVGFAYVLACLEKNNIKYDFIDTETSSVDIFKSMRKILNNNKIKIRQLVLT